MPLDIKPIRDDIFDCIQGLIATVLTWWDRDYIMMYANSWGFTLAPRDESPGAVFGTRLTPRWNLNTVQLIEEYCGIRLIEHHMKGAAALVDFFREKLALRQPVAVNLDAFWCPWSPQTYQKYHVDHYCLVIGSQERDFLCLDPYWTTEIVTLTEEKIGPSFGKCFTFSQIQPKTDPLDWRRIIANSLQSLQGAPISPDALTQGVLTPDIFTAMRNFATEFAASFDIGAEIEGYDNILSAPIFRQLKVIQSCRTAFARFLTYFAEKCGVPELLEAARKLEQASQLWEYVKVILVKMAMIKNQPLRPLTEKTAGRLLEIANFEEQTAAELLQIIGEYKESENR